MNILKEIVGSQARSLLIEFFVKNAEEEIQFGQLQKKLGVGPRQLTVQLKKIKDIGFIRERVEGNKKFYKTNSGIYYFSALKKFVDSISQKEEWWRWERASTIHHIYIVAQAGMVPMTKYFGICWPLVLMIYTGENILWTCRLAEMEEKGRKLIDWYKKPGNKNKYEEDIKKATDKLESVMNEVGELNVKDLNNDELYNTYKRLTDIYRDWYALLWTTELVAVRCEKQLDTMLAGVSPADLSILTALTKKSFSQEIEESFNALVDLVKEKNHFFHNYH